MAKNKVKKVNKDNVDKVLTNTAFQSIMTKMADEETADPRFTKTKLWVCHDKWNLNGSYLTEEVILEAAKNSLAGTPIVGFLQADEDSGDFAGHEEKLVVTDNGIDVVYLGSAFGFIPESAEYAMEEKEVDEVTRNYLVTDAIIWNAFEESKLVTLDGIKGQSMEIYPENLEYEYVEDLDGKSGFNISEMMFDKFCILGDDVTPAMTGALIETFTKKFSVDGFKQKVREYEESIKVEGGEDMKNEKKVEPKIDNTKTIEDENVTKPELDNVLTNRQLEEKLSDIIEKHFTGSTWIDDVVVDLVFFHEGGWDNGYNFWCAGFTTDGNDVEIDFNTQEKAIKRAIKESDNDKFTIVYDKGMTNLNNKFNEELSTKLDVIAKKLEEIAEYEIKVTGYETKTDEFNKIIEDLTTKVNNFEKIEVENLKLEKVAYINSVENITEDDKLVLVESIDNYSAEELKDEVYKIIGKNSAKFSANIQPMVNKFYSEKVDKAPVSNDDDEAIVDEKTEFMKKIEKYNNKEAK